MVDRKGWTVAEVYVDNDVSAWTGRRRPAYEALVEAVEAGDVDVVVCWDNDRLVRRPIELEALIPILESADVRVQTVNSGEYDLSTSSGQTNARLRGVIAADEMKKKSERQIAAAADNARKGRLAGGGTRPYGFADDRMTIVPEEADEVRGMVEAILSGQSLRGLVGDLNRRKVPTVTGARWQSPVLRRLLTSGRIAGLREYRGEIVAGAVWPAIVDREPWETVRALLLDPKRRRNGRPSRYLLTGGLTICGLCGANIVSRPKQGQRSLVCARDLGGCGGIRVQCDPLEDLVVEAVLDALDSPELVDAIREAEAGHESAPHIAAELTALEERAEALAELWADGGLSKREWMAAKAKVDERRAELEGQIASNVPLGRQLRQPDGIRARWPELGLDEKKTVLAAVLHSVEVGPAVRGRNFFDPDRVSLAWVA